MKLWYRSSYLKKDVAKNLLKLSTLSLVGPALIMLGFFLVFLTIAIIGNVQLAYEGVEVVPILICVGIMVFGIICFLYAIFITQIINKIDDIVNTIRQNEIIFLHDILFEGLSSKQRTRTAKKLVKSPNLKNFELIDEIALVKKKLHISADRLRFFMKSEYFGISSRITEEQLEIIENSKMINTKKFLSAGKTSKDFKQEKELLLIHKNPVLKKYGNNKRKKNMEWNFPIIQSLIWAGVLIFICGIVLVVTLGNPAYSMLIFFGMGTSAFPAARKAIIEKQIRNAKIINKIIYELQNNEILEINNDCFTGLNYARRLIVVQKLIDNKKIKEKEIIGGMAVVSKSLGFTEDTLLDYLIKRENERINVYAKDRVKNIKKIDIEIKTNCPLCGAPYRVGMKFCPRCGNKKDINS